MPISATPAQGHAGAEAKTVAPAPAAEYTADAGPGLAAVSLGESPRMIAQRRSVQDIHSSPYLAAQRREIAAVTGSDGPVQRVIETDPNNLTWAKTGNWPSAGFAGLPTASKAVTAMEKTTSPYDPTGMSTWKDKGYLSDPARGDRQTLTRMHAVRGQFGGPSAANNMFLGTAPSNNFNANSHFKQVEQPLQSYLTGGSKGSRAFDYRVTPTINSIPDWMKTRISKVTATDQSGLTAFANASMPSTFKCEADLYLDDGKDKWVAKVDQTLSAAVNADEGTEDDD